MAKTIAIINSNDDTVEVLRVALERAGFNTVGGNVPDIKTGKMDFLAFLKQHEPAAVIYDISLPYLENWTFLQLVLNTEAAQGCKFILTTTNKSALQHLVGQETNVFEIAEKPYDFEAVLDAVKEATKDVPSKTQ
jgi:DNA-binding NtrC family response regulator